MPAPILVWLRRDLRLADQPAFHAAAAGGAAAGGAPVVPVYVLDDEGAGSRALGGASRWWLHHSLTALDKDLRSVGSRLIKHLLIDWRHGERWFWDTLVDADYASNAVNWQWVSGSGVDASRFSRIMAPLVQSPKFAAADDIREWVPELAGLSNDEIHDPVFRPKNYPAQIVDHREARERALDAYRQAKSGA